MSCMFVPPYLLQRVALWAGTRHASASGKETLQVDDRLRARREVRRQSSPHLACRGPNPSRAHRQQHRNPAGRAGSYRWRLLRSAIWPLTKLSTRPGKSWIYFAVEFGRRSIDGRGGTVSITVHYGRDYDNAFWDGIQLVFGDGDGRFSTLHQTDGRHGTRVHPWRDPVHRRIGLSGSAGRLNESISDVFASMAKQRALGQTAAEADWLIGEGLFTRSSMPRRCAR